MPPSSCPAIPGVVAYARHEFARLIARDVAHLGRAIRYTRIKVDN